MRAPRRCRAAAGTYSRGSAPGRPRIAGDADPSHPRVRARPLRYGDPRRGGAGIAGPRLHDREPAARPRPARTGRRSSRACASSRRGSPGWRHAQIQSALRPTSPGRSRRSFVVAADGAQSVGRAPRSGSARGVADYGQHAIIAHVDTTRFHDYTAYERFTDTGPDRDPADRRGPLGRGLDSRNEDARGALALDDGAFLAGLAAGLWAPARALHPRRAPPVLPAGADHGRTPRGAARRSDR